MIGLYGRYLLGWAIVGVLLLAALLIAFPGVAGESGSPAAMAGFLVTAATDLAVFGLVLRALAADSAGFSKLWGLSVALKAAVFGSAIGLVLAFGWFPVDGFVRVLIVSFVVFTHHEVFQLVLSRRKTDRTAAAASPRS